VRLGDGGMAGVVDITLTVDELAALHRSAESVRQVVEIMESRRAEIDPSLGSLSPGIAIG
jgi:hypothetical protein